jgi:hypothetical protein
MIYTDPAYDSVVNLTGGASGRMQSRMIKTPWIYPFKVTQPGFI